MKIATSFFLIVLSFGCAKSVPTASPPSVYVPAGDMRLVNRNGLGSACPVLTPDGRTVVLTAGHVAFSKEGQPQAFAWSDALGQEGYAEPSYLDQVRDLAMLVPIFDAPILGTPTPYSVSLETPQPGDVVHWFEYDFRSTAKALAWRVRTAKVLRVVSGHVVYDREPTAGASGGCLLSIENKVVGIVVWNIELQSEEHAGIAVGIYGYR